MTPNTVQSVVFWLQGPISCNPVHLALIIMVELLVRSWWAKTGAGHDQSELHPPPLSLQSIWRISVIKKKRKKSQISECCTIPGAWHLPDISLFYLCSHFILWISSAIMRRVKKEKKKRGWQFVWEEGGIAALRSDPCGKTLRACFFFIYFIHFFFFFFTSAETDSGAGRCQQHLRVERLISRRQVSVKGSWSGVTATVCTLTR